MNRIIITMISIIVIISAIFTAFIIIDSNKEEQVNEVQNYANIADEEILDECTDSYEEMQLKAASSSQEKTSPNCSLTINTYFKKCGHTTSKYLNLPQEFVNLSEEEIQQNYLEYTIQRFASNEIVLYQEKDEECGEHYLLKNDNGIVVIYRVLENGNLEEQEKTSIYTEYLPEADKLNMEKGIRINGNQELNRLIEDFE